MSCRSKSKVHVVHTCSRSTATRGKVISLFQAYYLLLVPFNESQPESLHGQIDSCIVGTARLSDCGPRVDDDNSCHTDNPLRSQLSPLGPVVALCRVPPVLRADSHQLRQPQQLGLFLSGLFFLFCVVLWCVLLVCC